MPVEVVPVTFTGEGKYGDFEWMIEQGKPYKDALFIFNDNIERHCSDVSGGGNAVIRKYNRYGKWSQYPRSAGIPTGSLTTDGGFTKLDRRTKTRINDSIDEIRELIREHHYRRVFYSAEKNGKIGTRIFVVSPIVLDYITDQILDLAETTDGDSDTATTATSRESSVDSDTTTTSISTKSSIGSDFCVSLLPYMPYLF